MLETFAGNYRIETRSRRIIFMASHYKIDTAAFTDINAGILTTLKKGSDGTIDIKATYLQHFRVGKLTWEEVFY